MHCVIVLRGRLGATLEASLHPISLTVGEDSTEVVLDVKDDSAVYGVLERLERLGIGILKFELTEERDPEGGLLSHPSTMSVFRQEEEPTWI